MKPNLGLIFTLGTGVLSGCAMSHSNASGLSGDTSATTIVDQHFMPIKSCSGPYLGGTVTFNFSRDAVTIAGDGPGSTHFSTFSILNANVPVAPHRGNPPLPLQSDGAVLGLVECGLYNLTTVRCRGFLVRNVDTSGMNPPFPASCPNSLCQSLDTSLHMRFDRGVHYEPTFDTTMEEWLEPDSTVTVSYPMTCELF